MLLLGGRFEGAEGWTEGDGWWVVGGSAFGFGVSFVVVCTCEYKRFLYNVYKAQVVMDRHMSDDLLEDYYHLPVPVILGPRMLTC